MQNRNTISVYDYISDTGAYAVETYVLPEHFVQFVGGHATAIISES